MDEKNMVILVNKETDEAIGIEEKMKAHDKENGKWHRAISVFIFNDKGETMMQQRDREKYHSGEKWSNTCCSHPMPGESVIDSAHRRLVEEMGFDCEMHEAFVFPYEADVGSGLREREYDHIIFGRYNGTPKPDPKEVQDWKWIGLEELRSEIGKKPEEFTAWLRLMIDEVIRQYKNEQL
jgi:isopentenyl-diphosphate delta-isomerase